MDKYLGGFYGGDPPWVSKPPAETAPPLSYIPPDNNFWEVDMMAELKGRNALIYMDGDKNYHIRGDGVRLFLPFDWIVMSSEEDLVAYVRRGIDVSLAHRDELGY